MILTFRFNSLNTYSPNIAINVSASTITTDVFTTTDIPNEIIVDGITDSEKAKPTKGSSIEMITTPTRIAPTKIFIHPGIPNSKYPTTTVAIRTQKNVTYNEIVTKSITPYRSQANTTSTTAMTSTRRLKNTTRFPTTKFRPIFIKKSTFKLKATSTPKIIRKMTVPKLYIKTPPPTPTIIRKIVPYTLKPLRSSTKRIYPPIPNKENEFNDVIDVTMPKDNDETLLITSPFPEDDYSKEYWSEEVENGIDASVVKNVSETLKLLTQKDNEISNNNTMAIVVSSIGSVIFIMVIIFVTVKYFRYWYPRRRRLFSSSVSQSDVRFFPNDENLDFTLDNECYGKT